MLKLGLDLCFKAGCTGRGPRRIRSRLQAFFQFSHSTNCTIWQQLLYVHTVQKVRRMCMSDMIDARVGRLKKKTKQWIGFYWEPVDTLGYKKVVGAAIEVLRVIGLSQCQPDHAFESSTTIKVITMQIIWPSSWKVRHLVTKELSYVTTSMANWVLDVVEKIACMILFKWVTYPHCATFVLHMTWVISG